MPVKLSWSNMSAVQPAGELGEFGYFEDDLKKKKKKKREVLSPFIPPSLPSPPEPSVILAPASESSLMQFSKLFAWAQPTELSPLQNRRK